MEELFDKTGISYLFTNLNKDLTKYINKKLEEYNITRSEAPLLFNIYEKNGISQAEISKTFEINEATVTRALNRLEEKNLIKKISDKNDKRKKLILLTDNGSEICKKVIKQQAKFKNEIFEDFTEEELKDLERLLNKLSEKIKNS